MEIIKEVYKDFIVENIKCLNFVNTLKQLTRDDTNPLYKGFQLDQFR